MNLMDNFLGIDKKEWNTPIFRYATFDRALNLIAKGQNTLVSPRIWKDPFENILYRVRFRKPNGDIFRHPLRDRVYGQCWTMTNEIDAAWRMYVPTGNGVRLRTTIKKLYKSFENAHQGAYATMSCYIGRVEYKTEEELSGWFSDRQWVKDHLLTVGCRGQAESLLFKRKEFEPEQEVRLIYLEPHNRGEDDFYNYKFSASQVIEQITFDPRMENDLYETCSSVVRKLGYSGDINKSTLYRIPSYEITV